MLPIWAVLLILFGISLAISAIGFKKFVWFLSVGYGLSIFGCGIALAIIYGIEGHLNITGVIACALLVIYGFRLGGFLLFTLSEYIYSAAYIRSAISSSLMV